MGLLARVQEKSKQKAGVLPKNPALDALFGKLPYSNPTTTKTSTQAIPDSSTPDTASFVRDTFQALPRDAAAVGVSVANLIDKNTVGRTLDPSKMGPLGPALLGDRPVEGLADTAAGYERKGVPTPLAVLGATAPIGLDFLGFGEKTALSKVLAKIDDAAHIETTLLRKGVAPDLAKQYSEVFAPMKDPAEIEKGLASLEKASKTTKPVVTKTVESAPLPERMGEQSPRLSPEQVPPGPPVTAPKTSSLLNDSHNIATNASLNVEHLRVSDSGKQVVNQTVEEIRPFIEAKIGRVLTNKEVLELSDNTSKVLTKAVGHDQTLEWTAALTKTRQSIAAAAETGRVDKEFVDNILAVKTAGTDLGRKLQSFSITADPKEATSMQAIMEAVLDINKNTDEVFQAAKNVDFNDPRQAAEFYRKFVKPKMGDWVDLIRYNSMLSSPLTHIVNAFSNLINGALVAPVEKAVAGGLDWLGHAVTGRERKYFVGESAAHVAGYFGNLRQASTRFADALSGKRATTNLDTRDIPIATEGIKGAVVKTFAFPMHLLEASDQFFTALTGAGETAALEARAAKGVKVGNIPTQASGKAAYRLYREELFPEHQGHLLDAIDQLTNLIYQARRSDNPIVSNVAKFTVPFIRTPMNIFKQGLEYSPAGYFTLIGAANKTEQLAKAVVGSAVFAGATTLLMSGRITWAEPTSETDRNAFRAAGRQPYSVKIGDTWFSFQKLPPPIAFPLAMVALIDDSIKNKKLDQSTAELILSSVAKYGDFLADQSYAKSIGDLLGAFQGGESDWARVFGNVPQQLVPFRALGGWLARLTDDVQRKPDPEGTFVEKQVQLLMMNIPGLSQNVPARTDSADKAIESKNNEVNAFSPIRTSTEDPHAAADYESMQQIRKMEREVSAKNNLLKDQAEATWQEISQLPRPEMIARLKELKKANPPLHDKVVAEGEAAKLGLDPLEKQMKSATVETRAQYILDELNKTDTPEERKALIDTYKKKKILTANVANQIRKLKKQLGSVDNGQNPGASE